MMITSYVRAFYRRDARTAFTLRRFLLDQVLLYASLVYDNLARWYRIGDMGKLMGPIKPQSRLYWLPLRHSCD